MTRLTLAFLLSGMVLVGCGDETNKTNTPAADELRTVEINGARLRAEDTLIVNLNVCNAGRNVVQASESEEEVVVTARTDGPAVGDECSDGATVVLDDALGDRRLIDGLTGAPIPVEGVAE